MKAFKFLLVVVLVAVAFAGGYLVRNGRSGAGDGATARKVLYWVDPMHPAYKSDKPGIAPDCGMKLVPVYADGAGAVPPVATERKSCTTAIRRSPVTGGQARAEPGDRQRATAGVRERASRHAGRHHPDSRRTPAADGREVRDGRTGGRTADVRTVGQVTFDETRDRARAHRASKAGSSRSSSTSPATSSAEASRC